MQMICHFFPSKLKTLGLYLINFFYVLSIVITYILLFTPQHLAHTKHSLNTTSISQFPPSIHYLKGNYFYSEDLEDFKCHCLALKISITNEAIIEGWTYTSTEENYIKKLKGHLRTTYKKEVKLDMYYIILKLALSL